MDSNLLNKVHFHFVCTNYSSSKDGIGHYTSKVVEELKANRHNEINIYSRKTYHLSKLQLFFSLRMSIELIRLLKNIIKHPKRNIIILEYPFVEYNPIFFIPLLILKFTLKKKNKLVISLHEYDRTKRLRKLFIRAVVLLSDTVLYTKEIDVTSFMSKSINYIKRSIPANIEPVKDYKKEIKSFDNTINLCFFGIINFTSKEIDNMINAWEIYISENHNNKINFHFITSTQNKNVENNKNLEYHLNLNDENVSKLLAKMQFIILPIKPTISINNGSLSVGCIHRCIPIGVFDLKYFDDDFGIKMSNYSLDEFIKTYKIINDLEFNKLKDKENKAFNYGIKKSIVNTISTYIDLI